jgi:O-antigen/teichoic acid export membrane protein
LASALDYSAKIIVAFVITPLMVTSLGDFFYGAWQILMRVVGYMSPASGRPTQALKFILAKEQISTDYDRKRSYVGSTLAVLAIFSPLLIVLGIVLSWNIPYWIKAPEAYIWAIRITSSLLVLNLIAVTLVSIPQAVMEGENKNYKRMGLATVLVFLGGGLTWAALYFKTGIIGVAVAAVLFSLVQLIFYLLIVKIYSPWFGIARSSRTMVKEFLKLSGWFMAWNLIMSLMISSDIVILGLLKSVESVTLYTLSKYAPETLITLISMMVFGVLPGLSGIIGSGDLEKAAKVRGEIMTITWLVVTVFGAGILLWNRTFLGLWVGKEYFVGNIPNLLIILLVTQFILIRNDANVIDLTLELKQKVILGGISVFTSLLFASLSVVVFKMDIVGVIIGIMIGRLILSVAYPKLIGTMLKINLSSQIKAIIRPALVSAFLFIVASVLEIFLPTQNWHGLVGWGALAIFAAVSAVLILIIAYIFGLSRSQQKTVMQRVKAVILTADKK